MKKMSKAARSNLLNGSIIVITNDGDTSKAWFILDFAASSITYSVNSVIPEGPRDALVMLLWGLIPLAGSYFLFKRREV